MKIYIAGSSLERERYREAIRGIEDRITFNWDAHLTLHENATDSERRVLFESASQRCLAGVLSADALVLLIPKTKSHGAWFEAGVAYGARIPIYAVGYGNVDIWGEAFTQSFRTMADCIEYLG